LSGLAEAKIVVVNAILFWYIWGRGFVPAGNVKLASAGFISFTLNRKGVGALALLVASINN
jgi:hypothetical protein